MRGLSENDNLAVAVIPCLNEEAHIAGVVARLLEDPDWIDPLVVVADGGSTDATWSIVAAMAAKDDRIKLMANPGRIQSAAVNLAAKTFGEGRRYLVRVDAHAGYPAAYISPLVAEAQRTGAASVVVAMDTVGDTCFQIAAAAAQNSVLGAGGSAHRRKAVAGYVDHGHHALFDLAAFLSVGGYDETFSHNEDAELDVRLVASGARIWLTDAVALQYYPRKSAAALFRQYLKFGDGRARTILKHRTRPKLRQLAPLAVAPAAALALAAPWCSLLALPALAWAVLSLAGGVVLGLKARNVCAMAAGVTAMIMHLGWSIGCWRRLLLSSIIARGEAANAVTKVRPS